MEYILLYDPKVNWHALNLVVATKFYSPHSVKCGCAIILSFQAGWRNLLMMLIKWLQLLIWICGAILYERLVFCINAAIASHQIIMSEFHFLWVRWTDWYKRRARQQAKQKRHTISISFYISHSAISWFFIQRKHSCRMCLFAYFCISKIYRLT